MTHVLARVQTSTSRHAVQNTYTTCYLLRKTEIGER